MKGIEEGPAKEEPQGMDGYLNRLKDKLLSNYL